MQCILENVCCRCECAEKKINTIFFFDLYILQWPLSGDNALLVMLVLRYSQSMYMQVFLVYSPLKTINVFQSLKKNFDLEKFKKNTRFYMNSFSVSATFKPGFFFLLSKATVNE
jgi:hypothetical protein